MAKNEHLVGYANQFAVEPGGKIEFKISTSAKEIDVDLVRVGGQAGGGILRSTYGAKVDHGELPRRIKGRVQVSRTGSYIEIPALGADMRSLAAWSVELWIYPTRLHSLDDQVIMSTLTANLMRGWELLITKDAKIEFRISGKGGKAEVGSSSAISEGRWRRVVASYDPSSGIATLLVSMNGFPDEKARASIPGSDSMLAGSDDLLIGARIEELSDLSATVGTAHFNGRIEGIRLYDHCLDSMLLAKESEIGQDDPIAWWDFSEGVSSTTIVGHGPLGRPGVAVNMPTRAVAGHNWNGESLDYKQAPEQYNAIHFHDDDLEDANWSTDLVLTISDRMRSGVYALRCIASEMSDCIPFVILPGQRHLSKVAVILPSLTYLAYGNARVVLERDLASNALVGRAFQAGPELSLLAEHPEWGGSLYDFHSDGSGRIYTSWRRPLVDLRPGYINSVTGGPRNFSADICLLDWLDHVGIEVDVITDMELHKAGVQAIEEYGVVLTGSHPEYCTGPMLDAIEKYTSSGGRIMYLGANGFYWVTSIHEEITDVIEVRRGHSGTRPWTSKPGEDFHSTTGEPGGLWRHRGRPPNALVGVGFSAQGWDRKAGYYRRLPISYKEEFQWIFNDIDGEEVIGDFGLIMGGAAGDELDRHDPRLGMDHAIVLATSEGHSDHYCIVLEDLTETSSTVTGTTNSQVRSDVIYASTANGGAIFSVGSMSWIGALPVDSYVNNVSRITENVLRRFLAADPLPKTHVQER